MVALGDGQRAVQAKPVDQVGYLAESSAGARDGVPVFKEKPVEIPLSPAGFPNQVEKREGLPRSDDSPVDFGERELQIGDLVVLQRQVYVPSFLISTDWCL
jgi:hypothetical protein